MAWIIVCRLKVEVIAEAIELRQLVQGPCRRARDKLTLPQIAAIDELMGHYAEHGEPRRRAVEVPLRLPPSPIRRVSNQGAPCSLLTDASEVARQKGVGLYTTSERAGAKRRPEALVRRRRSPCTTVRPRRPRSMV